MSYKVLIIRLSSIGDIILTTALIRCLKNNFPDYKIDFLVKEQFSEIVIHNPYLNNIIVFRKGDKLLKLKQQLKNEKYEWIIDIHQNFRSLFLKSGSGVPLKTGYSKSVFKRSLLVYAGLNLYHDSKPVMLRYFESVEKQGVLYDGKGTEVFFPSIHIESIRTKLLQTGYTFGKKLFVVSPGASFSNKRWLPQNFAEVLNYLIQYQNGFVVLIGNKADLGICNEIQDLSLAGTVNFAGELSLLDSASLLSVCDVFIGNDSGMLHMAQSVKKPVVGIYGPTVEELGYFPQKERSVVVQKTVSCRPCSHNGLNKCPKKHFRCMKTISSIDVIDALNALLIEQGG